MGLVSHLIVISIVLLKNSGQLLFSLILSDHKLKKEKDLNFKERDS